jgi:hypothetical protein
VSHGVRPTRYRGTRRAWSIASASSSIEIEFCSACFASVAASHLAVTSLTLGTFDPGHNDTVGDGLSQTHTHSGWIPREKSRGSTRPSHPPRSMIMEPASGAVLHQRRDPPGRFPVIRRNGNAPPDLAFAREPSGSSPKTILCRSENLERRCLFSLHGERTWDGDGRSQRRGGPGGLLERMARASLRSCDYSSESRAWRVITKKAPPGLF